MLKVLILLIFFQISPAVFSARKNHKVQHATKSVQDVTNAEIKTISRTLRNQDVNKVNDLMFEFGEKIKGNHDLGDKSPKRLCQNFNLNKLLLKPTFKTLVALFDNYIADVNANENDTPDEMKEIDAFLEAIMNTQVIKSTHKFLQDKGFSPNDRNQFKHQLKELWFHGYSRAKGHTGSSGFEHVFVTEIKKGEVSGGHNWVFFCKEEQANRNNYEGYNRIIKNHLLKFRHQWNNYLKPMTSMFLGTSPEYEISIGTICFFARPNKNCYIDYDGENVPISTYSIGCDHKTCLATSFPKV